MAIYIQMTQDYHLIMKVNNKEINLNMINIDFLILQIKKGQKEILIDNIIIQIEFQNNKNLCSLINLL